MKELPIKVIILLEKLNSLNYPLGELKIQNTKTFAYDENRIKDILKLKEMIIKDLD